MTLFLLVLPTEYGQSDCASRQPSEAVILSFKTIVVET